VKNSPRKEAKKLHTASRVLTESCYFIRGRPMSTTSSHTPSTVSLADEETVRRILVDTLFGLWATVNNLTRLRPSRHERYRVTVFGSARTEPGHWVYEEVKQMCSGLTAMNCDIITGGGPGLMQAANLAAGRCCHKTVGDQVAIGARQRSRSRPRFGLKRMTQRRAAWTPRGYNLR
jgi:hypothetical protein